MSSSGPCIEKEELMTYLDGELAADRAARIAVGTVAGELAVSQRGIGRIVFCCFAQSAADHHIAAFAELGLV